MKEQQIRISERGYKNIHILLVYTSKIYQLLLRKDGRIANNHCLSPFETTELTK